jgi:hypothetical protein
VVVDIRGGLIELESPVVNGLRVLAVNKNAIECVECSVVSTKSSYNGKAEVWICDHTKSKVSANIKMAWHETVGLGCGRNKS